MQQYLVYHITLLVGSGIISYNIVHVKCEA